MSTYLPWLVILAGPVFMMRMMREPGHSGTKNAAFDNSANATRRIRGPAAATDAEDSGARIAEPELEVAELRGRRFHPERSRRSESTRPVMNAATPVTQPMSDSP